MQARLHKVLTKQALFGKQLFGKQASVVRLTASKNSGQHRDSLDGHEKQRTVRFNAKSL
jgi:hypothetical protein